MDITFKHQPGATAACIKLAPGQRVTTEGGAMIGMSGNLDIETTTKQKKGDVLKAAKRLLSGESFFLNHYTANNTEGEIWLSSALPGDMMTKELNGETLIVQGGGYVASSPEIDVDLGWQGFKSVFSGERVFWLKLQGHGKIIINSFGAIYPIHVDGETIVDTGHIVAFDETLTFKITKAGSSWISSMLGGEGLVCKFTGHGTVWVQSHNPSSFGSALGPKLRTR